MFPRIIGLTLNYRDPRRTQRCVKSLLAEGVEQVFVWDNSEDDGASAEAVRQIFTGESRVLVHQSPANLGFAAGVNRGLAMIKEVEPDGSWVLLINNDAVLMPGHLKRLASALSFHPKALLAYPSIEHRGRISGPVYYHRLFALVSSAPLLGSFPYASGCCQLIALDRCPGLLYDEGFFMYGEDVELGWRLGVQRMVYVPSAKVQHEGSASSRMGTLFYETRLVESHLRLTSRLAGSWFGRLPLLLGRLITLPARALVRSIRYRSLVPLKALWEGWRLANGDDTQRRRSGSGSSA